MLEDMKDQFGGGGKVEWDNRKQIAKFIFYLNRKFDEQYAGYVMKNNIDAVRNCIINEKITFYNLKPLVDEGELEDVKEKINELRKTLPKIKNPENIPDDFDEKLEEIHEKLLKKEDDLGLLIPKSQQWKFTTIGDEDLEEETIEIEQETDSTSDTESTLEEE